MSANVPTRKLSEVCEINPRRPSLDHSADEDTGFIPMTAVDDQTGTVREVLVRPFSEVSKGYTYFETNDVLFAKITPCMQNGKHAVVPQMKNGFGFGSTEFHVLRPSRQVIPEWIHFHLRQSCFLREAAGSLQGALGQQRVPAAFLENAELPVPDIATQRKIATRLKSQMAAVEQARQQLDAQIRDAEQLRLRYFRDAFGEGNLARWPVRSLSDLADIVSGMTLGGAKPKEPTSRVPYLRVANVKDGWLMLDDVKEIDATEKDIERFQLKDGDVVLTEGGDPDKLGRGTVWREEIGQCLHQNHIFRVRFDPREVCPEFAAYQFGSHHGKAYFLAHAKQTTGIASINKGVLSRFPFHLPDLPTQRRLAARLNESFGLIRRLQSAHQAQLEALDRLPAALLREAFASIGEKSA